MEQVQRLLTWTEVLVLLAVIVILSIVIIPNYLEAVSVSNLAIQKAHLQALGNALEEYKVDNGNYPAWYMLYDGVSGESANARLPYHFLTTPVNYLPSLDVLVDVYSTLRPDGRTFSWYRLQGTPGTSCVELGLMCNPDTFTSRSAAYLSCPAFNGMVTNKSSYSLWGAGPDGRLIGAGICAPHPLADVPYDPTNGAISNGHVYYFGPQSLSVQGWKAYE